MAFRNIDSDCPHEHTALLSTHRCSKGAGMSLSEHISDVIKSARELKKIADEMGNIELKSRLLEEIDRLQELREALAESGELAAFADPQENPPPLPAPVSEPATDDSAFHVIKPDDKGETYEIHIDGGAADEAVATEAKPDELPPDKPSTDSQEERFRLGEAVLRKLEPQHQRILKQMNDILTDEQKFRKQSLTREGQAAGKSANEIQQAVLTSLELTEKQQQLLAVARKELHDIRAEIARQVDGLLTAEQRRRLQKSIVKEIAASH